MSSEVSVSASRRPAVGSRSSVIDAVVASEQPTDSDDGEACADTLILVRQRLDSAIAQLSEGDFHSRWDHVKQLIRQFERQYSLSAERKDATSRAIVRLLTDALVGHLNAQEDPDIQWFLVRLLGQFNQPKVIESLAEVMTTTPYEDVQSEASRVLTQFGNSSVETLAPYLSSDNALSQRRLAARTLSMIRRTSGIEPLLGVAADPDDQLRQTALEALGSFHDERITPHLLHALNDIPEIAIEAIRALGRRRDLLDAHDLLGLLAKGLARPEQAVARESAIALGRLGDAAAVPSLGANLLKPLPTAVKVAIVRALGWLHTDSAIASLDEAFELEAPLMMPPVKVAIAQTLGQVRGDTLKPLAARPLVRCLQRFSQDAAAYVDDAESSMLCQSVLTAISQVGQLEHTSAVVPFLSHPDDRLSMHALSALRQIAPDAAPVEIHKHIQTETLTSEAQERIMRVLSAW